MTRFGDGFTEAAAPVRFGNFVLDPAAFRLTRDGEAVRIEPKALEVLSYLIRHPDRVVSKDELLDGVWRGTFVTPNALTRAVAQLRKALGDAVESPRYIETVPTRGYRFIGVPQPGATTSPSPTVQDAPKPETRTWPRTLVTAIGSATITALLVALAIDFIRDRVRAPEFETPGPKIQRPNPAPRLGASPLITAPGLHVFPALAPDGNRIAWSSDASGTPQIHVAELSGASPLRITSDSEGAIQPSWSPDGKQIVYATARRGGLRIVPSTGGAVRNLTAFGSRPAWSPDGDEVVFQTGQSADFGGMAFEAYPPSSLSIVKVASGQVQPLTRPGTPPGGHGAPNWRRDSKRIAFASCEIERCAIYTVGRDGSSFTEVARRPLTLVSPAFLPHGRRLVHVLNRFNGSALMATGISGDGEVIEQAVVLRGSEPALIRHVAVSPDGSRFAWSQTEETSRLMAIRLNAAGRPTGEPAAMVTKQTQSVRNSSPVFSPDGARVAWSAIGAGDDSGIWIADADGKNPRPLSVGVQLKQNVRWAPDGWAVLYSIWQDGPVVVGTSLINGRNEPKARAPRDASPPVMSPDGKHLAFNRSIRDVASVWVMSTDEGELRRLTRDEDLARFPVWSADGTQLAVQVRRPDGTTAIATIPADGGELRILTTGGESRPSSWSADGRFIAFAGKQDGVWNIWSVRTDTGALTRLTGNNSVTVFMRDPVWSPDGKTILYESGTTSSQIWLSNPAAVQ